MEELSEDEDYVPYVPLKERRRLELEKREKYLKRKTEQQPTVETVRNGSRTIGEEIVSDDIENNKYLLAFNFGGYGSLAISVTYSVMTLAKRREP